MTSLAEYNNNPGNIRPAKGVTYEGMIGVDDKGFAIFEKPEQGQQALINDLTHKIEKRGIKTPNDFVDVYAPKSDENSEESRDNYKMHIANVLGLKSTSDPFPENAINDLAKAVTSFENGSWQKEPKSEEVEGGEKVSSEDQGVPTGAKVPAGSSEVAQFKLPYDVSGGVAGASLAAGIETGKQALPAIRNILSKTMGSDAYMYRPQSPQSLQRYLNSQLAPNLRVPLAELEKVTGGNPIRTMSEVQNALDSIKEVQEQKITKPVYKPTSYGSKTLVDTGKVIPSTIPGRPAVDLSAYEFKPTMVNKAIEQAKSGVDVVRGALPSVGRVALGGLGGALAANQLYDAFQDYVKEGPGLHMPSLRTASKFASGVGGALSTVPFPLTQGAGLALQAPELAISAYDAAQELNQRRKSATRDQTNRMLTNVDPMGNPLQ